MSHDFMRQRALRRLLLAAGLFLASFLAATQLQAEDGLPVAEVKHEGPVDFQREILPILRRNCIACHNTTDAESDLVLETPQTILKGGSEGPGVVPGNADESLIFLLAAHRRESFMPPEDNASGAKNLTPEELGLLKLWINEGATGEVTAAAEPIRWQPLPPGLNSIYSVAVSSHGQYIAAARANQVFLYHLPARQELGRLTDPVLISSGLYKQPGVAHLDMVQSLAFSPDETRLVSGGFRSIKIWQRPQNVREKELPAAEGETRSLSVSRDGRLAALGQADGKILIYDCNEAKVLHTLTGHTGTVTATMFTADGSRLVSGSLDKTCRVWNVGEGKQLAELATESEVTAVALVRNGEQLAVGSNDNHVRIWPLPAAEAEAKPEVLKDLTGHTGPITALAVLDGVQLLSASKDGTARLWNAESGEMVRQFEHKAPLTALAVRADKQRLATAAENGTTKLWNLEKGEQLAELTSPGASPFEREKLALDIEIAKRFVETDQTDLDKAAKLKEAEEKNTKEATEALAKPEESVKQKVAAAKKAAEEQAAGEKKLADAKAALAAAEKAKQEAGEKQTAAGAALTAATAERDAKNKALAEATAAVEQAQAAKKTADEALAEARKRQEAAQGGEDAAAIEAATAEVNTATEKQAAAEKAVQEAEAAKQKATEAQAAAETALASADTAKKAADEAVTKATAAVEAQKGKVPAVEKELAKLADAAKKAADEQAKSEQERNDSQLLVERAKQVLANTSAEVARLEKDLAEKKAAQTKAEEQLAAFDKAAEERAAQRQPHRAVAFSPDGTQVAVAGDATSVHVFSAENGALLETITAGESSPAALAYLGDKRLLTVAQQQPLVIWQTLPEWKLERTIGSFESPTHFVDRVTALGFSPDGKLLATGGGEPSRSGELKLWDVATGELVREIPRAHSDTIFTVVFSPDGKHLATGGADRVLKVFDVGSGEQVKLYEGHTHHVLAASWRVDGRVLVSSGADQVVKVWDFVTNEQLKTITGFDRQATSVQYLGASDEFTITAGNGQVVVKNSAGGNGQRRVAAADNVLYVTQSTPDGQTVVAGGEASVVHVWNEKGEKVIDLAPPPQKADTTTSASP